MTGAELLQQLRIGGLHDKIAMKKELEAEACTYGLKPTRTSDTSKHPSCASTNIRPLGYVLAKGMQC